ISTVDAISEDVLDTQFPILISENHESLPSSKSLFGYTVSLAQGKIPFNDKVSVDVDGWIFIGAPKSNASKEYYADDAVEPGVLWRCSLGRRNGKDNCEIMNVDPKPSSGKRNEAPAFENHSGAFIGGALELNHDHLLTCGWRWNRGRQKFYNGICYWFQDTNDTSRTSFRSPDLAKLVNTETYEQRLLPFFVKIPEKDRLFHFIDSDNKNVSAHEWQISLFGVNTHLFLDKGGLIPNLLVGAPGVREYSGAVVLYTNTKTPTDEEMARTNRNNDPTFSQFVVGNRGVIPDGQTRRTYWNEYFGYSVSSGRYLNKDQIHYVSGAPRAHHCGEVIIFDIPLPLAQQPRFKRQVQPVLEIKPPGNSFGSYFGAVLHSVDLDGDGQDELIVGAPLYTLQSSSSSKNSEKAAKFIMEEYGDHGSVFVYNFSKIEGKPNERYSFQHLNGSRTPRAQFGSAISSIKFDYINGSKETYLVVGAPYEKSDSTLESSGAIYLYKYNVALGKYGTLSQRIVASQLSSSLKGFGSSLSIPQDIDFNKTPDIAIGSYMSGQAVVLRTRPKVLIKSWVEFNSEKENITQVRRGFSRNTVNDRAGNSHNEIVYLKKRSPTYGTDCQELEIESVNKDGIGMDDSDEFKERIHFTQEVRYNDTVNRPLTVLNYTATSGTGTSTSNSDINFTSFQSGQPTSQISKTSADLLIQPNDCRGPVCIPLLAISSWSFYNEKNETISSFLLGSSKEVRMQIVIENNGETAVKPRLILDWDNVGITESDSGSHWLAENCKSDSSYSNRMTYRCKLGQHLKNGRNKTIDIDLNMADIYAKQQENYAFDVNGAVRVEDAVIKPETGRGMLVLEVPYVGLDLGIQRS
ncbi:Integrin alpha-4, partial [Orchesella cincta]